MSFFNHNNKLFIFWTGYDEMMKITVIPDLVQAFPDENG